MRLRVRLRSGESSKSGSFRLRAVETSKVAVFGQNFLQILQILIELMFDTKFESRLRLGQVQVTKGHHTQNTYIRRVTHLLPVILHVEYDGDSLLAIRAHLGESRYMVRSTSGQKGQILKCLILENKDMFLLQNDPRNPMAPFVFLYVR